MKILLLITAVLLLMPAVLVFGVFVAPAAILGLPILVTAIGSAAPAPRARALPQAG